MKVKIIKGDYWFHQKAGEVLEVRDTGGACRFRVISGEWKDFGLYEDDVEIINEEKVMKKSDLRSGMRVVHGKHSRNSEEICIVIKDLNKIMFPDGSWNYLSSYAEDLTMSGGIWDITEVYDCPDRGVLDFTFNTEPLLWKREEKTPEQKQLQEVMTKISELQEQANKLQGLINK